MMTEKMRSKLEEINGKLEGILIEENLEHVFAQWFMWFLFYYKDRGLFRLYVSPRVEKIFGDIWQRRRAHSMEYFFPFSRRELDFIWRQIKYNYSRSNEFSAFMDNLPSLIWDGYYWNEEITVWHRTERIPVLFVLWNEVECPSFPCHIVNIPHHSTIFKPWIIFRGFIYDKYWWWSNEQKTVVVNATDDENFLSSLIEATENLITQKLHS